MSALPGRDHISGSTSSLDGKGGTDSAAKAGKSTKRTGPSYDASYPENSTPGFNGLIYSCSILSSIHQTRRIRIKSPSLQQQPFHWLHSVEIFCPSSYCGIYQAVPVQNRGPFGARQGASFHITLKPSTQRRLCPPLSVRSFWARPVRTRSDRVGCRVGEEDRGLAVGESSGTL